MATGRDFASRHTLVERFTSTVLLHNQWDLNKARIKKVQDIFRAETAKHLTQVMERGGQRAFRSKEALNQYRLLSRSRERYIDWEETGSGVHEWGLIGASKRRQLKRLCGKTVTTIAKPLTRPVQQRARDEDTEARGYDFVFHNSATHAVVVTPERDPGLGDGFEPIGLRLNFLTQLSCCFREMLAKGELTELATKYTVGQPVETVILDLYASADGGPAGNRTVTTFPVQLLDEKKRLLRSGSTRAIELFIFLVKEG
jgi:hypothetical protein